MAEFDREKLITEAKTKRAQIEEAAANLTDEPVTGRGCFRNGIVAAIHMPLGTVYSLKNCYIAV